LACHVYSYGGLESQHQMKNFFVTTSDQDEEGFLIEAKDINEAREMALRELGWYVVEDEEE
jgi:hypothetical protein